MRVLKSTKQASRGHTRSQSAMRGSKRAVCAIGASTLIAVLAGAAIVAPYTRRTIPQEPQTVRFSITLPVTDRLGVNPIGRQIALSPNGRVLVYAADDGQLFARTLGQLEVVPIPGSRDARYPFISPDGQWVGYFSPTAIRKVALSGGLPITVCRVVGLPFGATWTADGTVVFGSDRGLMSVPAAGGEPRPLTTQAENSQTEGLRHVFPQALPGGRAVLFTMDPAGRTADTGQIAALDVATGHYRSWCKAPVRHSMSIPDFSSSLLMARCAP